MPLIGQLCTLTNLILIGQTKTVVAMPQPNGTIYTFAIVEVVQETKLLGTIITSDLKWEKNTDKIVKDANKRLRLLHAASKFSSRTSDLKTIYLFIRSKLEQSAVVWSP